MNRFLWKEQQEINISRFLLALMILPNLGLAIENNNVKINDVEIYELPKNCDFMQVRANTSSQFDCSPKLKDPYFSTFRGILINGPEEVIWPTDVSEDDFVNYPDGSNDSPFRLNIAGLTNVPDSTLNLSGNVAYEVVVVAINEKNAQSYSGKMIRMGEPEMPVTSVLPGFENVTEDAPQDTSRSVYFNIDLVNNLGIPITETSYHVYATLGEYKSNVLTIKTSIK